MAVLTHEERGVAARVEMYIVAGLPARYSICAVYLCGSWMDILSVCNRGFARQINTQDCE